MKLLLIFSTNISLKDWDRLGILEREILIYQILSQKILKIKFLTYGDNSDLKYSDILKKIQIIPIRENTSLKNIPMLKSIFFPLFNNKIFKDIDVIKTNQMDGSWLAWLEKIFFRKKLIVRCGYEAFKTFLFEYNNIPNRKISKSFLIYYYIIELISYKLANKIITTNLNEKNFITRYFKINPKKVVIIPNYIDTNKFKPININKKEKTLLFVGSLNKYKNLENLIESLNYVEEISLDIIGDGILKEILTKKVNDLKLNERVNFLGRYPNSKLPSIINKYELFILPSFSEGNPKALLEAMSCGMPCIGTNIPGIREIITHNENGYICNFDSKSISEAIKKLSENRKLREKIGSNARKFIENNYSVNSILKKERELYISLYK